MKSTITHLQASILHFFKTYFILVLLLLLCVEAIAQTTHKNIVITTLEEADSLYQDNKFDASIVTSEKAIQLIKEHHVSIDSLHQKAYLIKGNSLKIINRFDEAKIALETARSISTKSSGVLLRILGSLGELYNVLGDVKQAENILNENLKLAKELHTLPNKNIASAYLYLGRLYFSDYKKSLKYCNKALNALNGLKNVEDNKSICLYFIGSLHRKLGDNQAAMKALNEALEYETDAYNLCFLYTELGLIFYHESKYQKSIDYFKKAEKVAQTFLPPTHTIFADLNESLSATYEMMNHKELALTLSKKALEIYKTNGYYSNYLADKYQRVARNYHTLNDNSVALKYQDSVDYFLSKAATKNTNIQQRIVSSYYHRGIIYSAMKAHKKSLKILTEALQMSKKLPNNDYTIIISNFISELMLSQNNFLQANSYLSEGSKVFDNNTLKGDFSNLKPEKISHLLNYFNLRTELFKALNKDDKTYKDSLLVSYQRSLKLQDYIQANNIIAISKDVFLNDGFSAYENYIDFLYRENNKSALRKAFTISEKTKTRRLQEALNEVAIQNLGQKTDSLLHLEKSYNIDIAYYDQKKYELESVNLNAENDSLIRDYDTKLFDLKNKREHLQKRFKEEFPNYYNLKYNHSTTKVETLQKGLKDEEALVQFFVGDSSIFSFVITKDDYKVTQIKKDFPLKEWVNNLRSGIQDYWVKQGQSDEVFREKNEMYLSAAFKLHEKLIAPIAEWLPKKLIIIPDGALYFVPFDALITQETTPNNNFKEIPYLIKKHQISYNYSATLFDRASQKKASNAKKDMLALAPSFVTDTSVHYTTTRSIREGLLPLKHNVDEAKILNDIYGAEVLQGTAASKSAFLNQASNYKVIHLATHAKSNDKLGDYSFIAFGHTSDSIPEPEKLYVRELYNLNLDAEMVVLSACETGLGKLQKGEGVISLGSAFTYAGARSTVTSLWNVNDAQTTKLMKLFYENLNQNMPKDEALRQAKLTYLSNESLTAPFFWAGFVPSGDMRPLELSDNSTYIYMLFGIVILFLIAFIYLKKHRFYNNN